MGVYFNPNNESFTRARNSQIFIDKIGLIHLGYLRYDSEEGCAYIPNFEVAKAYQAALNVGSWTEIAKSIAKVING